MVVLLAVLVLGLVRRVGELERSSSTSSPVHSPLAGPAVGTSLPVVPGYERVLAARESGQVLLFLSSSCGPCTKLARALQAISGGRDAGEGMDSDAARVLITDPDGTTKFADLNAAEVITQTDGELSRAWGIPGTPFAVAVDRLGMIRGSAFVNTPERLNAVASTLVGAMVPQ